MKRWYDLPQQTKINAYTQIGELKGMGAYAVEKDWWVVQTLTILFELEIGEHLVFKGGTSLSKAWSLIQRFSEDIDLAVNRTFFGYEGNLSKHQRSKLRKEAGKYTSEILFDKLKSKFLEKGLLGIEFEMVDATSSDQDPRIINIHYPSVIETHEYILPKVQLEIGARSLFEPFVMKEISSLLDEYYPNKVFTQKPIKIPTVIPERTFLEKIFLLHEEFQRPKEKVRVNRLSRHLYDIYQLSKTDFAERAILDKELYETIVKHRKLFTKVSGVDYSLHQPQTINPLPTSNYIKLWKEDYKIMQEKMIYGDSPSFDAMINGIQEFINRMNQIEWNIDI